MAVNLSVQDDAGDVDDANSYVDLGPFQQYCANRGYDLTDFTTDQQKQALILATDYLDTRHTYRGVQLSSVLNPPTTQTTQWPRAAGNTDVWGNWDNTFQGFDPFGSPFVFAPPNNQPAGFVPLVDANGQQITGIPQAVKNAQCEYAFRVLLNVGGGTGGSLFKDAPAQDEGFMVRNRRVQVDVISQDITFEPRQMGAFAMPAYPPADLILARAGLIVTGRVLFR